VGTGSERTGDAAAAVFLLVRTEKVDVAGDEAAVVEVVGDDLIDGGKEARRGRQRAATHGGLVRELLARGISAPSCYADMPMSTRSDLLTSVLTLSIFMNWRNNDSKSSPSF
jgi:hypothetical protein